MKGSLTTSAIVHAVVLSWGLVSLGAPDTLEVADVDALPVELVSIDALTQIQRGERDAAPAEQAAPTPTTRSEIVPDAVNVGDNMVDLETTSEAEATPRPVEAAAPAPEQQNTPQSQPVDQEPVQPELASLPEPAIEPIEEVKPEPEPQPEFAALPEAVPTPQAKPQRPAPRDEPSRTASIPTTESTSYDPDQIAALLNKQEPSGGGAARASQEAALGGRRSTAGDSLTLSEMDALRGQIQRCWNVIPGMADGSDVRVRVTMRLAPNGEIEGQPQVTATGGTPRAQQVLTGGALRAVIRCAPYQLPAEKYAAWSDVIVNFDPSQLF